MNFNELKELINIEFSYIDISVDSINELCEIITENKPDKFQLAAMSKIISDVYNGIENILKRICKYLSIPLPIGGFYHTELLLFFSNPTHKKCPILFDDIILDYFKALLKFRHYVVHGYAFQLEWSVIEQSARNIDTMVTKFKNNVFSFLNEILI